jgi:hypothetical protein
MARCEGQRRYYRREARTAPFDHFRELRRNGFEDPSMPELAGYYCVTTHDKARARCSKLRKLVLPAVSFVIDVHFSWFSLLLPRGKLCAKNAETSAVDPCSLSVLNGFASWVVSR